MKESHEESEQVGVEPTDQKITRIPPPSAILERLESSGNTAHIEAYRRTLAIAEAVREKGGMAFFVGGFVRDALLGHISKDLDIEVFGLEPKDIDEIARTHGKTSDVGKAFGILKLACGDGVDIDISLPRTDSKIGDGHRGFEVKFDPFMSVADASRRRDFTINSMAADPLTGELQDPFNGQQDIEKRILRVTDAERFRDDPLRVMRALQFMSRFGMSLEPESARIIHGMLTELKALPKERIVEEWRKMLLKSEKPSIGLAAGMSLGVFAMLYPDILPPLAKTRQDAKHHPEGDVWIHTLMALDEAAYISRRDAIQPEEMFTVMMATLCHDFGKPDTTIVEEGNIRALGHEEAGMKPANKFMDELGVDNITREKVVCIVRDHLKPTLLYSAEKKGGAVSDGAIRKLAHRIHPATIRELVLTAEADHAGRGPFEDPEVPDQLLLPIRDYLPGRWLLKRSRELNVETSKPEDVLKGRELIALGFKPGKSMGDMIRMANTLRDDSGMTRESIVALIGSVKTDEEALTILDTAVRSTGESVNNDVRS